MEDTGDYDKNNKIIPYSSSGDTERVFKSSLFPFLPASIHAFRKYLLCTYYVPGTLQGTGGTVTSKTDKSSSTITSALLKTSPAIKEEPVGYTAFVDISKDDSLMGK